MNKLDRLQLSILLTSLSAWLCLAACIPDYPAENPYDPETPAAQQAKAQLRGKIIPEAQIEITEAQLLIEGQGVVGSADMAGDFTLELAAGQYLIKIQAPSHEVISLGTIVLNAGEIRDFGRIKLSAKRGRIEGRVNAVGATNLAGTLVSISTIDRSVFTDESGDFSVSEVPVGTYQLMFLREAYATQLVQELEVVEGETSSVSVSMAALAADSDFSINDNARYTADRNVKLNLAGFSFTHVQISEDRDFSADPAPVAIVNAEASFELSNEEGDKTIYVRFTNEIAAPFMFSKTYSASIILDQTAPEIVSMILANNAAYTARPDLNLALNAFDQLSGISQMQLVLDGTPDDEPWQAFTVQNNIVVNDSASDGQKTVQVRVRDLVGNESPFSEKRIILDTVTPTVSGAGIVIDNGTSHTQSPDVELTFEVAGASELKVYNQGAGSQAAWQPFPVTNRLQWRLAANTTADPAGETKTVTVQFKDAAGNETSPYSDDIQLDMIAPLPRTLSLAGADTEVNSGVVSLSVTPALTGTDLQIVLEGPIAEAGTYTAASLPATVNLLGADGSKTVSATLLDAAGNESTSFSDTVLLDRVAPSSGSLTLAGGLTSTNQTQIDFALVPSISGTNVSVRLTGDILESGSTYNGSTLPAQLNLTNGDGTKTVNAVLIDVAGNESVSFSDALILDTQAPIVNGSGITINQSAAHTNDRQVVLSFTVSEATQLRVRNQGSAITANYQAYPVNGDLSWTLEPLSSSIEDGEQKTVFVQFRDGAGNETTEISANIILDTIGPGTRTLVLDGGSVATSTNIISLSFVPGLVGTNLSLSLGGDLDESGTYPDNAVPSVITLTGADGLKTLTAVLYDQAGNNSLPFTASVELDRVAPVSGEVVLADNRSLVNDREISVTISNTNPDYMSVWEGTLGQACEERACASNSFVPFSPATSLTLSAAKGNKLVCWKFCDEAGNGTATGQQNIELGTYLPRPQPVLSQIEPTNYVAFSQISYPLTITGRGIASDTRVQVGAFTFTCDTQGVGADCEADSNGACAVNGNCANTCATSCTINLDSNVMANSGTYVVRIDTPDPVFNGLNESADVAFFSVVAPVPEILTINPRGIVQELNDSGLPIGRDVDLSMRVKNATNNVSFRLGPNFGRIQSRTNVSDGTDDFVIRFTTAGLVPGDLVETELIALNPAPGGGSSASVPFGVNPKTTQCPSSGACVSLLRRTRVNNGTREGSKVLNDAVSTTGIPLRGVEQSFQLENPAMFLKPFSFSGADAVSVSAGQSGDILIAPFLLEEALSARVRSVNAGGKVPFLFPPVSTQNSNPRKATVRLEADLPTSRRIRLYETPKTEATGRYFRNGTPSSAVPGGLSQGLLTAHFGDDPNLDFAIKNSSSIQLNSETSTTTFGSSHVDIEFPGLNIMALEDMNGDDLIDVVALEEGTNVLVIVLGAGGSSFEAPIRNTQINIYRSDEIVDLNRDGLPDILRTPAFSNAGAEVFLNLGNLRFERSVVLSVDHLYDSNQFFTTGNGGFESSLDLNMDGHLDIIMPLRLWENGAGTDRQVHLIVAYGHGDGTFEDFRFIWSYSYQSTGNSFEDPCGPSLNQPSKAFFFDLNIDGRLDLVRVCNFGSGFRTYSYLGDESLTYTSEIEGPLPAETGVVIMPQSALVIDMTNDSIPDLVAGLGYDFSVPITGEYVGIAVYEGKGDGSFEAPHLVQSIVPYSTSNPMNSNPFIFLHPVDTNLDGHIDFIGAQDGVGLKVIVSETQEGGPGQYLNQLELDFLEDNVFADFDRDGNYDYFRAVEDEVLLYLGNGDGSFQSGVTIWSEDFRVRDFGALFEDYSYPKYARDIDGDGNLDIILHIEVPESTNPNNYERGTWILRGDGLGAFSKLDWDVSGVPQPQLLNQRLLSVCNLVPGSGGRVLTVSGDTINAYVYDDRPSSPTYRSMIGGPILTLNSGDVPATIATPNSHCVDINSDGHTDLILNRESPEENASAPGENGPLVLLGDGTGALTLALVSGLENSFVESVGDFNQDGFVDLQSRVARLAGFTTGDLENCLWGTRYYYGTSDSLNLSSTNSVQPFEMENIVCGWGDYPPNSGMRDSIAADVDGDGRSDAVRWSRLVNRIEIFPNEVLGSLQDGVGGIISDRSYISAFSVEFPSTDQIPPQVLDLNHDQTPDIVAAQNVWLLPTSRPWIQELGDLPPMSIMVPEGTNRFRAFQRRQYLEKLAVRVSLDGEELGGLELYLRNPNGDAPIRLDSANQLQGQAGGLFNYSVTDSSFLGWQNSGAWALEVVNTSTRPVQLLDFKVITYGSFYRPMISSVATNPKVLDFPGGSIGRRINGTTTSHLDTVTVSCANTSSVANNRGTGEAWYEFTLGNPNVVNIAGLAEFDAAIELRAGACDRFSSSGILACDHNTGLENPLTLSSISLGGGTYCLVVDGVYDSSRDQRHSGQFDIALNLQTAIPTICGDGVIEGAETCDDGNTQAGDGCRSDCTIEACADGVLDIGEACDDGNTQAGDGCRADCTQEFCGDGIVDNLAGEACDDGNTQSGDGCQSDCLSIQSGWGCFGSPSVCVPGFEQEPNDDSNQASSTGVSGASLATVSGTIDPATDEDFWSFTVPALSSMNLSAHIYGTLGNTNSCNGDSVMQVFDGSSTELAFNDDSNGLCSSLSNVAITNPGLSDADYYIRLQSYDNRSTFLYLMDVTLQ